MTQHIVFNIVCINHLFPKIDRFRRHQVIRSFGDDVDLDREKIGMIAKELASQFNSTVSVTVERIIRDDE